MNIPVFGKSGGSAPLPGFLARAGGPPPVRPEFHPLADEWSDILIRERRASITPGHVIPILTPERASLDLRLTAYAREAFPRGSGQETAKTYLREVLTWCAFLETRGARWDEATPGDVRAYQAWRVYDERNPSPVEPATWNKGMKALSHLYDWAVRAGVVEKSPVGPQDGLKDPFARNVILANTAGGHVEKHAQSSRNRWVTPAEYRAWRDIAFRAYVGALDGKGRMLSGLPDGKSRIRNTTRNSAWADLVWTTGLREAEAGKLLSCEIPGSVHDDLPVIGKGKVFRRARILHPAALSAVSSYMQGERARAVARAQGRGLYPGVNAVEVVDVLDHGKRGARLKLLFPGQSTPIERDAVALDADTRLRLMARNENGQWEPLWLWLTESGTPVPTKDWSDLFADGNSRVTGRRRALGIQSPWVNVTPHSLRFSFALIVLLAGVRETDRYLGRDITDPFDPGSYSHVFDEVRDLLGHASVETTKSIYLEPLKGLRRLPVSGTSTVTEMFDAISDASPLVGLPVKGGK